MQLHDLASCATQPGGVETGNVAPLLHQVRHALQALLEDGTETVIDLRAIPLAPGEEDRLHEWLGRGEVKISIDALGPSEIAETAYPGVWISTHHNQEGAVIGRYIEVCLIPAIAAAQQTDMEAGLQALNRQLDR